MDDDILKNLKKLTVMIAMKNSEEQRELQINNQHSSSLASNRNIKISVESPIQSNKLPTIHHELLTSIVQTHQKENLIDIKRRKLQRNFMGNGGNSIGEIIHIESVKPLANRSPKQFQTRLNILPQEKVGIYFLKNPSPLKINDLNN